MEAPIIPSVPPTTKLMAHANATLDAIRKQDILPPTPPLTASASVADSDSASDTHSESSPDYPLPPPSGTPQVLELDKKTPDTHVPRDPRLIRLTGVHPFNVEAPLSALFREGFLTSPELFYVRNHGAVPEVKDEDIPDWEFSIEGEVERPMTIKLKDLITDYEQITCPVTFVCAGNRRKEQNVVRKSNGFSWGAGGLSTALFTGTMMWNVIKACRPKRNAKYVCMEGADKLPNGYYGTSVKLNWVRDPNRGIMLSHMMNGEMLRPDHGKPLRAVIPGQIGGRSVKWLKKLIVTEAPSDNWYHIYDNRVLPTTVSPEVAAKDKSWWTDERYAIYDLSVNSAIAFPAHDEKLKIADAPETYKVEGYAYSGGGRRVTRVELSLDQGKTWRLANIDYAEDRYRETSEELYGGRIDMSWRETCFCWCFWAIEIPVSELADSADIVLRAMDESMCIQPKDMYWSVLGMMNNPWFRIVIHRDEAGVLRFEHPTQPALMPGGWMERVKKSGGDLTNGRWGEKIGGEETVVEKVVAKDIVMTKEGVDVPLTVDELKKHDGEDAPWFVVNGHVYDGTAFLKDHPGGAQSILSAAGLDSTDEFMAIHSETAKRMMPQYHIGSLNAEQLKILATGDTPTVSSEPRDVFLQSRAWSSAALIEKRVVSSDSRIFRYKLEHESQLLGLPTGQHLMMRLKDPQTNEAVIRSYTPISESSEKGFVDILIKVYFDEGERKGGKMSQAMDRLPLNSSVDFKGPIGKFEYLGRGRCSINGAEQSVKKFMMIAGGSGVTPIYQVFRAVMRDQADETECLFFNGNRLQEDILLQKELNELCDEGKGRGKILYTLSKPHDGWEGLRGRVTGELVKMHCGHSADTLVLICGPETMERSMREALTGMGWSDDQLLFF